MSRTDWQPSGSVEEDLRSRLLCIAEAACWDRPYEERIAAIHGLCDLTTNGLTPKNVIANSRTPEQFESVAAVLGHLSVRVADQRNVHAAHERRIADALFAAFPNLAHLREYFPAEVTA